MFKENSYGGSAIETVADQKLISTGPYAFVRHPMYVGVLGLAPFTASSSAALSETINKAATTLMVQTHPFGVSTAALLTATVAPLAPGAGTPTGTVRNSLSRLVNFILDNQLVKALREALEEEGIAII